MKAQTDNIASITESPIGRVVILVAINIEACNIVLCPIIFSIRASPLISKMSVSKTKRKIDNNV